MLQLLPSLITATVAVIGFFVFHRFALVRQYRTEINDYLEEIHENIQVAVAAADKAWLTASTSDDFQENERAAKYAVLTVGQSVASLKLRDKRFDVDEALVEFRKTCTAGIDDTPREPDPGRLGAINLAAESLRRALDRKWAECFPSAPHIWPWQD